MRYFRPVTSPSVVATWCRAKGKKMAAIASNTHRASFFASALDNGQPPEVTSCTSSPIGKEKASKDPLNPRKETKLAFKLCQVKARIRRKLSNRVRRTSHMQWDGSSMARISLNTGARLGRLWSPQKLRTYHTACDGFWMARISPCKGKTRKLSSPRKAADFPYGLG